ncbi:MAG: PAS domain S-box protein [Desulfohalobiaceae bacterium]|nr:PAS domain S-box protein [Desulfohalobiaceae bacterium]
MNNDIIGERTSPLWRYAFFVLLGLLGTAALYGVSTANYLLYHSLIELLAVGVAVSVFSIGWNTRHIVSSNTLFLLAVAYGCIAGLDLLHTLAYTGMGVFPDRGSNLPTQLWIATRFVESLSLLAAALLLGSQRRLPAGALLVVYGLLTGALLSAVFSGLFPAMYVQGLGLTPAKIGGEYLVCAILAAAAWLFWRQRESFPRSSLRFLLAAIGATLASELSFTLYTDVYGVFNFLGHLLKLVSVFFIYRALVSDLLLRPYEGLFRDLARSRDSLQEKEIQLRGAEKKLRAILDTAPSGIILVNPQGGITFANERMAEMLAYELKELIGTAYLDHTCEPQWLEAQQQMNRLIRGEIDYVDTERLYRRKDDTRFWGNLVGTRMSLADGSSPVLVGIITDISARKEGEERLMAAHDKLDTLVQLNADGLMVLDRDGVIRFLNPAATEMLGRKQEELLGKQFGYPLTPGSSTEIELLSESGDTNVAELRATETNWSGQDALLASFRDITGRKRAEEELRESREELEAIYDNAPLIMLLLDSDRRVKKANKYSTDFIGLSEDSLKEQRGGEVLRCIHHLDHPSGCGFGAQCEQCTIRRTVRETFRTGQSFNQVETTLTLIREEEEWEFTFLVSSTLLQHQGEPMVLLAIVDITERKKAEKSLRHMSFSDTLTWLYNRNFFEEEMNRLSDGRHSPMGLISCDVDGLKFINDSLGHQSGDELLINTAEILRKNFRSSDIIARIGGDEFAILVPGTDRSIVEKLALRLRKSAEEYNNSNPQIPLSLSIGYTVSEQGPLDMQALFREADNRMYREKMQREGSGRNVAVQALTRALEARDFITEGHSERLQGLVASLARSLELPEDRINDLLLLAQFHDLGKVGIPDRILFKPGPLTEEEWREMQKHSEIGHRIAQSIPDLAPIADWILKHHERWDGQGYPLGLSGEDIPLECRGLAIADAYDSMTSDRPYRKAMSREEAIGELKRCMGTQFDPQLTEKFSWIVQELHVE